MMSKSNISTPGLHFSPSGSLEGFTSAGVQGFNELNPDAIVREFIQNSLDAVREDGRTKAIVRFELNKIGLDDVPAIMDYSKAFEAANRCHKEFHDDGQLPDQAAMVTDAIANTLGKVQVDVLSVLDNGIGLDKKRMNGLLGDGMSMKSSAGAGAVGNGHLTAIPTSDLRYVLYGGVSLEGTIASGHAILASFLDNKKPMGKDGYYILDSNDTMKERYIYPTDTNMAPLIKNKLDWIKSNFENKTGAAIIIPGFNSFREANISLWDTIKNAAACSFFTAIADDHLEILYHDDNSEHCLNNSNLDLIFSGDLSTQKRARSFLSGSKAADAYMTATKGNRYTVNVGCGQIELLIRETDSGPSRIDLCRNGMWVTNSLPRLQGYNFTDRQPFHCLIKVTAQDGEIHKLIRKSEGPLHNHIEAQKWLKTEEQNKLNNAFNTIKIFILEKIDKLSEDEYSISDFLTVKNSKGMISGGNRRGGIGNYEAVPPRNPKVPMTATDTMKGVAKKGGSGNESKAAMETRDFKRSGNKMLFGAVPVPTGNNSYSVELFPKEDLSDGMTAEIRFILDEGIDETCDQTSDEKFVTLNNIRLNGHNISDEDAIKSNDFVQGVRLEQFQQGKSYVLDFTFNSSDDEELHKDTVLRAEIVRRKSK